MLGILFNVAIFTLLIVGTVEKLVVPLKLAVDPELQLNVEPELTVNVFESIMLVFPLKDKAPPKLPPPKKVFVPDNEAKLLLI